MDFSTLTNNVATNSNIYAVTPMKATVIVRKDLNLSPGKLASQVAHAALGLVRRKIDQNKVRIWQDVWGEKLVVLQVENESELNEHVGKAQSLGLINRVF